MKTVLITCTLGFLGKYYAGEFSTTGHRVCESPSVSFSDGVAEFVAWIIKGSV